MVNAARHLSSLWPLLSNWCGGQTRGEATGAAGPPPWTMAREQEKQEEEEEEASLYLLCLPLLPLPDLPGREDGQGTASTGERTAPSPSLHLPGAPPGGKQSSRERRSSSSRSAGLTDGGGWRRKGQRLPLLPHLSSCCRLMGKREATSRKQPGVGAKTNKQGSWKE